MISTQILSFIKNFPEIKHLAYSRALDILTVYGRGFGNCNEFECIDVCENVLTVVIYDRCYNGRDTDSVDFTTDILCMSDSEWQLYLEKEQLKKSDQCKVEELRVRALKEAQYEKLKQELGK